MKFYYPFTIILITVINITYIQTFSLSELGGTISSWVSDTTNSVMENAKGYKELLSSLNEFRNTVQESISNKTQANSNITESLKRIFQVIIQYCKVEGEEKKQEEHHESVFRSFYNSFFSNSDKEETLHHGSLVKGIFQGLSENGEKECKCYEDLGEIKEEIAKHIGKVVVDFQKGEDLIHDIIKIYEFLQSIKDDHNENCKFNELIEKVALVSGPTGTVRLSYRLFKSRNDIYGNMVDIYSNFRYSTEDLHKSGVALGKMFKIVLDFSLN
jgi:hypothetical protein